MKAKYKILTALALCASVISCETVELDLQQNPNQLNVDQSDPNYILNSIQLRFNSGWGTFNDSDMQLVRMENLRNTYASVIDESTLQEFTTNPSPYTNTYDIIKNAELLFEIADEENLPYHKGMANFFIAYSLVTLVDHLGPVPLSEANLLEEFPNPSVDDGAAIYEEAFNLLDEAEANFNEETVTFPSNDLFYGGNADNWIKAINSLRLKMYITTRLVNETEATAGINEIIASGEYIDDPSEDFFFKYNQATAPVDSRHPLFRESYSTSFVPLGVYMSNDFINLIKDEKGFTDPRLRYYIYRQVGEAPSGDFLPCEGLDRYNYCYTGDFYWGRDHKDAEGIPNDGPFKSTYGIYPAGGAYDDGDVNDPSTFENVVRNQGLNGAGIRPYWLSSFSSFSLAEAALTLGTSGDASNYLEDGIRRSFDRVERLSGIPMDSEAKEAYITGVMDNFSGADDEGKLEIVMTEYYLALFGNGVEAYNTYRRTGYPNFIPGVVNPDEPFANIYLYPADVTTANSNISQRSRDERVFWDVLPATELN